MLNVWNALDAREQALFIWSTGGRDRRRGGAPRAVDAPVARRDDRVVPGAGDQHALQATRSGDRSALLSRALRRSVWGVLIVEAAVNLAVFPLAVELVALPIL